MESCRIQVQKRLREIKNADDLRRVVLDTWTCLGLHYILSLYDSIPRRIRCVLRSQITKYHSFKVRKLLLLHEMLLYKFQFSAKMFITSPFCELIPGQRLTSEKVANV